MTWAPADTAASSAIDWVVEGNTYGCYTGSPPAAAPSVARSTAPR